MNCLQSDATCTCGCYRMKCLLDAWKWCFRLIMWSECRIIPMLAPQYHVYFTNFTSWLFKPLVSKIVQTIDLGLKCKSAVLTNHCSNWFNNWLIWPSVSQSVPISMYASKNQLLHNFADKSDMPVQNYTVLFVDIISFWTFSVRSPYLNEFFTRCQVGHLINMD